jgi:hypothetical protein
LHDIIAIAANQAREFCGAVGDIEGIEEFDFAGSDSGSERPRSLKQQGKRRTTGSGGCYRGAASPSPPTALEARQRELGSSVIWESKLRGCVLRTGFVGLSFDWIVGSGLPLPAKNKVTCVKLIRGLPLQCVDMFCFLRFLRKGKSSL